MYEIPARASPAQILEMFEQGRVVLEQLTVVEGSTFADFRRELDQHAAVTHTLTGKDREQVMTALGHPGEFHGGPLLSGHLSFCSQDEGLRDPDAGL